MREIKYQAWLHDERQMINLIEGSMNSERKG